MKRLKCVMVYLSAVLLFAACGGDGNSGEANNGGETGDQLASAEEVRDFLFERALAYRRENCELMHSDCPNSSRYFLINDAGSNVEECIALQRQRLLDRDEMDQSTLESGRRAFDADKAVQCLDALANEQNEGLCSELSLAVKDLCTSVIEGSLEGGEPCLENWDCQSNRCAPTQDNDICYGECNPVSPLLGEGEACSAGDCDRSQNLFCGYANDGSGERICVATASREEGDSCITNVSCKDGLRCHGQTCVGTEPAELGEACLDRSTPPVDQNSAYCIPGLYCLVADGQEQGTCTERGSEGDPCGNGRYCDFDYDCDFDTDTCITPGAIGDSCEENLDCGYRVYCDLDAGVCTAEKVKGEACEEHVECRFGYTCKGPEGGEQTCQPYIGGESCELPADTGEDTSGETSQTP